MSGIERQIGERPAASAPPAAEKRVFIQTFGCQMNTYDTAKMLEILKRERFTQVDRPERADLILINTCAIREKPEHKVFSLLGGLEGLKLRRPEVVIGVAGCMAQQAGERILQRARAVDLVFGTDNLFDLPEMLADVAAGERVVRTERRPPKARFENFIPDTAIPGLGTESAPVGPRAQLAITKGCNNMCTFCVVPYTRGREVSRSPDNILQEARALVEQGAREILLLGQNVNSYRAEGLGFVELLERLNDLPGLARIRYTSPHPKDFDARLARAHAELDKLCEHLHLPFQSGSDRILRTMRRNHTIATYLEKLERVRALVPQIALSTDIIVGFPGETEEDFQATLDVVREVRFDHMYAFKFSPRTRTPAAELPDQLPEPVKAERLSRLLALHEAQVAERNASLIGSRQEILVEGPHPRDPTARTGRTRGNTSATVVESTAEPGALVPLEIVSVRKFSLVGRSLGHGHGE